MKKRMGQAILFAAAFFFALTGCATVPAETNLYLGDKHIDLKSFIKDRPIAAGENIRNDLIAASSQSSVHLVQIRGAEKPHIHAEHDLRVVVVRGRGTMMLGGRKISAGVGSVFEIRRGTPHHFINTGTRPAAGVATFTPPYDGKDNIPVSGAVEAE